MSEYITPEMFSAMFISGAQSLRSRKDYINELNVFPVPDGDTGTNMVMTLDAALKALYALPDGASLEKMGRAVSDGALRGARGNSGVIMSQLIRGFAKGLEGKAILDKKTAADAAAIADEMARKAVANPKEGTILTVAGAAAKKARELCGDDISMEDFLKEIAAYSDYMLGRTPEMLPVLKEAGVVDSGGQGLVEFIKGAYKALTGQAAENKLSAGEEIPGVTYSRHVIVDSSDIETSDIIYTYCTEFIVNPDRKLSEKECSDFRNSLEKLGNSLVFVCTDEMVRIHIHTNHPGFAFEKGLEYGPLTGMKVDNMKEEHYEKLAKEEQNRVQLKEYGFVSVCAGEGIKKLFKDLSVDAVVEGGQTMNPSAEDIAKAIKSTGARSVFVLPNNSNVILTASQAGEICRGIDVKVIPTKNTAEGISAVINYLPALSAEENAAHMEECLKDIKTAQITYAVRDSETEGVKINKGDYMAISEGRVVSEDADLKACALGALKAITDEDSEIISIYYGEGVSEALAREIADAVQSICPDADTELINGGQPVYGIIISAE